MKKILMISFFLVFAITMWAQENGQFQVLTGYEADLYNNPNHRNFQVGHVGFGYKGNFTAIYGKVNLGYLYKEADGIQLDRINNQTQFEIDYWQILSKSKSTSFWLNYAYSQQQLFPNHRIIFEVWQKLFAGFLVSSGVNHYRFTDGSDATFVNLGFENYFGRWWVEGKSYVYLKKPKITTSYSLTGRVFFKDVNFLQLGFSAGSAQDEPFLLQSDLQRLFAYSGNIKYTTNIFNERMRVATGFTYMYEEHKDGVWRSRYAFGVGLIINITK